jgi:hypothetical protein
MKATQTHHRCVLLVSACLVLSCPGVLAQERPEWINKTPVGYLNDYFVGTGSSQHSLQETHQQALEEAMKMIIKSGPVLMAASETSTITSTQIDSPDSQHWEIVHRIASELSIQGHSQSIQGLVEEERYLEYDGTTHTAWSLVRIPKTKGIESPPTVLSAVWRSALLPGWGQIYKGETAKGVTLIGSEALLIPGAIIFNNLKTNEIGKAASSRTQILRDFHTDRANLYRTLSLTAIILAGTLYTCNVVDAIVIPGDKVYVDDPLRQDHKCLCLLPGAQIISIRIRI